MSLCSAYVCSRTSTISLNGQYNYGLMEKTVNSHLLRAVQIRKRYSGSELLEMGSYMSVEEQVSNQNIPDMPLQRDQMLHTGVHVGNVLLGGTGP
ncbi:hypothetical protein KIN20_016514 [Parelaphostrongylus tenuis]|uniref:Uncharacterized protein n=1 Tax=Parelaphostrongylus tenuis TaxID=148309 RepID=A0AAD5QQU1_PARTN|nr:hypothetical protein KIN20_016514 [Parelaphostrongylus tenuis]